MADFVRDSLGIVAWLLVTSLVTFALVTLMPCDPVELAIRAWNLAPTSETVTALRSQWGLDQPFWVRYLHWLVGFVQGNWGLSFRTGTPVLSEFTDRLPVSFMLGAGGLAVAILIAIPLGFFSALHPGGLFDWLSRILSVAAQAIPAFWSGLVLLWFLGAKLHWISPFSNGWDTTLLAILLIASHSMAVFARVYATALRSIANEVFFQTALSKGLSKPWAFWHHGNKMALCALIASVYSEAGWMIGGTATMEILFNFPGISQFLVQSIEARDQMVLQAYVMVIAFWMACLNLITQGLLCLLDPRNR